MSLLSSFLIVIAIICCTLIACSVQFSHENRPINIGHRGTCGVYPEHTIAAYQRAVDDGADMIECDITITKDLQLICRHENALSVSTDVAERPKFKDKMTTRLVNDVNTTDWYAADFTLSEVRQLYAKQVLSFRDQSFNQAYRIATLDEFIQVAHNASRGVGIYPEIKEPAFINSLDIIPNGQRFEDIVVEELKNHGYAGKDQNCILQSFEEESLRYIKEDLGSDLPLGMMHWIDVDDATLDRWAAMGVVVIGFWKDQVFQHYKDGSYKHKIVRTTDLIEKIHARGLKAHVFTFRNEDEYLPWDDAQDPYAEYDRFLHKKPDAYFTDFPATFKRYLDSVYIDKTVSSSVSLSGSKGVIIVLTFIHSLLLWLMSVDLQ